MHLFLYSVLAFGQTEQQNTQEKAQNQKGGCDVLPDLATKTRLIQAFYNTKGPFTGIFTLNLVADSRLDGLAEKRFDWHVRYQYVPVPDNPWGRIDAGYDERIFSFHCDDNWYVTEMGPHMSAVL